MSFDGAKQNQSDKDLTDKQQLAGSPPSLLEIYRGTTDQTPKPIVMADAGRAADAPLLMAQAQIARPTEAAPPAVRDYRVFVPALQGEVTPEQRLQRFSPGNLMDTTGSRNSDNSVVYTDAGGRPRGVVYTDGSFSGLEYDRQGNLSRVFRADKLGNVTLNEIRRNDGRWSSFKDGQSRAIFEGTYSVRPNGCVEFLNNDSTVDRWDTHGGKLYSDSHGKPLSMTDRNNLKRDYGYDDTGALSEVRQTFANGASQIWRQEQGIWNSYDGTGNPTGNRYDGRISVDADGSIRQQDRRTGDTKIARPDGTSVIIQAPADYRPWEQRVPEAVVPVGGDRRTRVNPDSSRVLYEGDGSRPTSVICRDGTFRRYQYDASGNLAANVSYDGNGQIMSTLRREGDRWVMRDASGVMSDLPPIANVSVSPDGAMVTRWASGSTTINKNDGSMIQFDRRNNLVGIEDPTGEKRRLTYDNANNLAMVEYMNTDQTDVALRRTGSGWQLYNADGMPVNEPPVQDVRVDRNGTIQITRSSGRTTMYTDGRRVLDRAGMPGVPGISNIPGVNGIPGIVPRILMPQRWR